MNNLCRDYPDGLGSVDRLFSVFSSDCNRYVLHYFEESSEGVASLEELAEYVAVQRSDTGFSDPDRVATRLHHSSLPKLAEADIIDYNRGQRTVRYRHYSVIEECLDFIDSIGLEP